MTDDAISMEDRQLHYLVEGNGPPILWIHGFPLGGEIYRRQLEIEAMMHIVPDLAGFGQSDPYDTPEETTIRQYTDDLLRLLDALKVEQAVVAGLSMGGYIAFDLVRAAPLRLSGLILIDTKATPDDDRGREARIASVASIRKKGTTIELVDEMLPKLLSDGSKKNQELVETLRSLMASASVTAVVAAQHAMARRPDASTLLPEITCPALVVAGREDVITPPDITERISKGIPGAEMKLIEGAGHLPPIERPHEFNRVVRTFVESRVARGEGS